ncbi:DeoR/GlpR family DNA-binding transcription regulator [Mesonia aestuariivivens]|uniref:DeoR/GlpR family DNA-binding transcription regulator n=1 Tax=Mesonia aestuariivivens TaxID=2796128 RepID=A0ABS6VXX3_9FLAO|nr:DeoR/GlpR family DNA-binding transcription regulator [Mesonia aestuariivivens]MBW2960411.1 DeoR/GlpR family DNA-binding transcription regulator [Mesonia aestuariivivens]
MKRHQEILEILQKDKYVEVSFLCEKLGVSAVTIRKDLKRLEDENLLFRTHGGASLENPYMKDRTVNEKEKVFIEEKSRIAKAAAALISENDSFLIASGTTVQALAKAINIQGKLNIITSSLNVAIELLNHHEYKVIQLGGNVRHSSSSVIGHYASLILDYISCNQLFIGVDGIDLDYGCTTTSLEEAALNQKMINSCQKIIVLADSSKFGKKSFGKICSLKSVHHIITDSGISSKVVGRIKALGIKITVV